MSLEVRTPAQLSKLAAKLAGDFEAFAYEGFGIRLSAEQMEVREQLGRPGPRESPQDPRFYFLSGGQRSGKTVLAFLCHAEACLYKVGIDNTDPVFWRNYQYRTLNIGPTDELALRLWGIALTIRNNANEAQWDRSLRRARPGAFLPLMDVAADKRWGLIRWRHSVEGPLSAFTSFTDFRSSEGKAKRLEGTFWQFFTWDEWASQPDYEIEFILEDVLMGRARDRDAKIMPMAWPKPETERHLIAVERALESGVGKRAFDSRVIYLSAAAAYFTNRKALATEEGKDPAKWARTVLGRTAGGAAVEFTGEIVGNLVNSKLPRNDVREDGYRYFTSADLGLGHDSTVIGTWRIPIVDSRPVVSVHNKARLVHAFELKGSDDLTLDMVTFEIAREQQAYNSLVALDATSMGGLMAVRQLRSMNPSPLSFKSRSNDRVWGNMRLAAITNGLDLTSWGKPTEEAAAMLAELQAAAKKLRAAGDEDVIVPPDPPWGLLETPRYTELIDQLANFDRTAKDSVQRHDDWVWMFLIAAWYIRRFWADLEGIKGHQPLAFDPRPGAPRRRRGAPASGIVAPAIAQGIRSIGPLRR